jgi:hypothetical protein
MDELADRFEHSVSAEYLVLLRAMSCHLARVASPENDNKMSLESLILILSPTLVSRPH